MFKSRKQQDFDRIFINQNDGLREKTIISGFWLSSPNDFGLYGIALLTLQVLETFSRTGFRSALIQRKKDTGLYLNTVWTLGIIRRFLLASLLFFTAPYAAAFFKASGATPIIRTIALALIFRAFMNISVIYFEKELEFHKYFVFQSAGTLVDVVVSIGYAILFRNLWALVIGYLSGVLTRSILSYIILSYRPAFNLDFLKARELFGFGKWILGSSILVFVANYLDDIFVGKLLGTAALGFYQMAFRISNRPINEITTVFSKVTFPAYSKIQESHSRMKSAYFGVMKFTSSLSFVFVVQIICLAPDITRIVLGEKWQSVTPIIQLIAVASLLRSIVSTASPLFKGGGRPEFELYMQLANVSVMILAIYPLIVYRGISGAAVCVILSTLGMSMVWYPLSKHITQSSWQQYIHALWPPLVSSLLMAGSLYLVKSVLDMSPDHTVKAVFELIATSTIGLGIFVMASWFLYRINPDFSLLAFQLRTP